MIRISWQFKDNPEQNGHGEKWFEDSERPMLENWIERMDEKYPEVIHWIEETEDVLESEFIEA